MAASLPTLSKPVGKKMDADKIGFQPVKQLYMSVIDGVMDSVEEVFLDEGIDKEIWHELLHVWQSKLVDWNVLDQVVERPRPEQNRNGLPTPPPRPLPPFCPANEEKTPVYIETSIAECDSLSVVINVPFASIHDGKLQQALALPEMVDILKDKNLIHTLEFKVLEAIENLTAAAALNDTTNTGNEPSTSAQHEPMDLSGSVAGPVPMSLSRQGKALEEKESLPEQVKSNPNYSLMVSKLAAEMVSKDTATPTPKKRQRKVKELGKGESSAIAPSNSSNNAQSKIKLKSKPEPVQGILGNDEIRRPSELPSLAVAASGKVDSRGRPKSNTLATEREGTTLPNKNECSTPSDRSSLTSTQPVKLNHSGKKSNPAVTLLPNKRGRGRLSKTLQMTVTEVKVNRGGKQVRFNPEEANQLEQFGRGLLPKQESISEAAQVIPNVGLNAAVMKIDGITPPKKRGRPPNISRNPEMVYSGVESPHVDRESPNVIVIAKPDLPDQTEGETTTSNGGARPLNVNSTIPKRRGRSSKVVTSPSPKRMMRPKVEKPSTPKRRGRPSKVVSSPSPKRIVPPPNVANSTTPKRRGWPSKVVSSAAHLDGATADDDSDSDYDDQDASGFGLSSLSSHNLANMAKIVKNVLGTSVRNTERKANMEEQDENDSEMEGQDPKSKVDDATSDSDWGDCETDDDDDGMESTRREPWYSGDAVVLPKASMYCQYEKITRTRNKWKFFLKDGIMHLDGKDYVFQKAHGDAMW